MQSVWQQLLQVETVHGWPETSWPVNRGLVIDNVDACTGTRIDQGDIVAPTVFVGLGIHLLLPTVEE
jgi:hypothetical protein